MIKGSLTVWDVIQAAKVLSYGWGSQDCIPSNGLLEKT